MGGVTSSSKTIDGSGSISNDGGIRNNFLLDSMQEHRSSINCMAISEDGSVLVTGSEDSTIRMWTTKTEVNECIGILAGHENYINCVLIEEIYVLSGSADCTIRKWDMSSCDCLLVLEGHNLKVNRIICTGDYILSSSSDKTIMCWDFLTGECIREYIGHQNSVIPLIFVPGKDSGGSDGDDVDDDDGPIGDGYRSGDVIVSGSNDYTARSWSFLTGKVIKVFRGHEGVVTCLATDPDGKLLLTGSTDCTLRSWNLLTGEKLRLFAGHTASIICCAVVNRLVFTGSSDKTARAWTIDGGFQEVIFKGHNQTVICIKHQNGAVMTGASDGHVICYDAKTGNVKRIFRGRAETVVNCLQVVGTRLFAGSIDGCLRVWDLRGLNQSDLATADPTN